MVDPSKFASESLHCSTASISSFSSASFSPETSYYEKCDQFGDERLDGDSTIDLDAELAMLDELEDEQAESRALLSRFLPWRRRGANSLLSIGSTSNQRGIKADRPQRRHGLRLISVGAICAVFGSLGLAYLLIDDFLPTWPAGVTDDVSVPEIDSVNTMAGEIGWNDPINSNYQGYGQSPSNATISPLDPTVVIIPSYTLGPPPELLQPLEDRLPYPLLEEYFARGRLPASVSRTNALKQHNLDLVYLWVNATSPYFQRALDKRANQEAIKLSGKRRHWRDNGELRGAVRSAMKALGPRAGNIHVLTTDLAANIDDEVAMSLRAFTNASGPDKEGVRFAERDEEPSDWRLGQIPIWLDWNRQGPADKLKWHFHSEICRLPQDNEQILLDSGSKEWVFENEEQWRRVAMPGFNSNGIESRIAWVNGLSENFIACNDDMFMMRELSTSDFRNPLLGNMIRLDPGLLVQPFMNPSQLSDSGEWGALQHANQLLSDRFPSRKRMYMHHLPKTQAKALAQEANVMWAKDFTLAATRGFRESKRGKGDVAMAWMITHLRVERWREALLWSWVVGKVGGVEGVWGVDARRHVRDILLMKGKEGDGKLSVKVARGERRTLKDLPGLMKQGGWEGPKATTYHWSSMDGHLPSHPEQENLNANEECDFNLAICLGADFFTHPEKALSASDIFKNLAFSQPDCGDCLIKALVRSSGKRGIDAFLPTKEQVFYPKLENKTKMWERSEPILPLVATWMDADFSLEANIRTGQDLWSGTTDREDDGVELRRWCIKLLSRYNYVYAGTPSRFAPVRTTYQLTQTLESIDSSPEIALLCVNDDQSDRGDDAASDTFGRWMEKKWGGKIAGVNWEKIEAPWIKSTEVKEDRKEMRSSIRGGSEKRERTLTFERYRKERQVKVVEPNELAKWGTRRKEKHLS